MSNESLDTPAGAAAISAPTRPADRIETLDFIRGIAVMGILAANIVAFGQPFSAYMFPDAFLVPVADPGGWLWIAQFVVIDGKMRALFTVLFGAGMYLFMERAWARGSTRWLQFRRLALLGAFGLIHFFFIWIGDILFFYALLGSIALLCLRWSAKTQFYTGLIGYIVGALLYAAMMSFPFAVAETSVGGMPEFAETRAELSTGIEETRADDAETTALKQSGDYAGLVEKRLTKEWFMPAANAAFFSLETLPLMLLGMALYRFGFFSGSIARSKMVMWGWIGLIIGALVHLGIGLFVKSGGFAFYTATAALMGWSALPRLPMALGMAALMVAYSPQWGGWLAERIRAAGRAAFTNYLGTSILMMFVFHGWALGLFGELNRPQLYLVVLLAWVVMLAWSKPWLERFKYGPLEWLWRCLTYGKMFANRR